MEGHVKGAVPEQAKPSWVASITRLLTEEHQRRFHGCVLRVRTYSICAAHVFVLGRPPTVPWITKHARLQFNASDLRVSSKPVLPPGLAGMLDHVIKGPVVLQVCMVCILGASCTSNWWVVSGGELHRCQPAQACQPLRERRRSQQRCQPLWTAPYVEACAYRWHTGLRWI